MKINWVIGLSLSVATAAINGLSQEVLDFSESVSGSSRLNYQDTGEVFVDPERIEEDSPNSTFRIGPVDFLVSANYSVAYDNNIRLLNRRSGLGGSGSDDVIHTFGPSLRMTVVDPRMPRLTLAATYSPRYLAYTDNTNLNNSSHSVVANATYNWAQSVLNASQSFSLNQQPTQDIGGQRTTESWNSNLGWNWFFSEKTQYETNLSYSTLTMDGGNGFAGNDNKSWNNTHWLAYQIWPKIFLGPEVGIRFSEGARNGSFWSELLRVRISYVPTEKLTFGAFLGAQISQFDQGGGNTSANYGGDVFWRPWMRTRFGLSISQQQQISLLGGARSQITRSLNFTASQQLVGNIQVTGNIGYRQSDFQDAAGQISRQDEWFNTGLTGSYLFSWGLSAGLFYEYQLNQSDSLINDFNNHRVGAQFSYQF
jgi:hypothetical protein